MKPSIKTALRVIGLCGLVATAIYASWVYSGYLVNQTVTVSQNFTLNLNTTPNANGISRLAAQAIYSQASPTASTFNDGTAATGTITITSPTNLGGVKSTATVTVVSNVIPHNAQINLNGTILYNGISWTPQDVSSNTAVSIVQGINYQTQFTGFTASTTTATKITITCGATGTNCNGATLSVNTSSITASATFSGGRNNAVLTINGIPLSQGNQWSAVATASGTAKSISDAIQANLSLSAIINSTWSASGVVSATSTTTGLGTNYAWTSSNQTNMALSNSGLFGGKNAAFQANAGAISVPNNGFATGLGVVYSTGSGVGISPLVVGTTYYVIALNANTFELATSTANAVAGTNITLTSQSLTGPHTFTLTPQDYTGTAGFAWYGSNDGVNYNPVSVSSVTYSSPSTSPTSTLWDFGRVNFKYLQLQVNAPTTGGLSLAVNVNGN